MFCYPAVFCLASADGYLDKHEFRDAIGQVLENELKYTHVKRALIAAVLFGLILLAVNFGLTAAVVYLTKDTDTSSDGVMRVKGEATVVRVRAIRFCDA